MALRTDTDLGKLLLKSWEELEAMEHAGYLLFPAELRKLKKDGTWEVTPVALRVPREPDMRESRMKARSWASEIGLDPQLDPDLFDNMETMIALSMCIRNATPPHEQWEPDPRRLERIYDRPCLDAIWAQIEGLRDVIDPRPEHIDEDTLLGIIGAVARARNIAPLTVFAGRAQNYCIVTMAERLQNSPGSK